MTLRNQRCRNSHAHVFVPASGRAPHSSSFCWKRHPLVGQRSAQPQQFSKPFNSVRRSRVKRGIDDNMSAQAPLSCIIWQNKHSLPVAFPHLSSSSNSNIVFPRRMVTLQTIARIRQHSATPKRNWINCKLFFNRTFYRKTRGATKFPLIIWFEWITLTAAAAALSPSTPIPCLTRQFAENFDSFGSPAQFHTPRERVVNKSR